MKDVEIGIGERGLPLRLGDGRMIRNLTVFPIFKDGPGAGARTLDEAIAEGGAVARETGEVSWIDLEVGQDGGRPLFIMDGEGLVAGMQNRVVATAILAEAGLTHRIPVTCVEQGRWSGTHAFKAGSSAYPSLRAILASSVGASLRAGKGFVADQKAVWTSVSKKLSSMRVSSATSSMHDVYTAAERAISAFTEGFNLEGASGFIALAGEELVGLDILPGPDVMEKLRLKLAESYALDAMERMGRVSKFADQDEAISVLDHLRELKWREFPGVSLGRELRGEDSHLVARALFMDGEMISLSAFAKTGL